MVPRKLDRDRVTPQIIIFGLALLQFHEASGNVGLPLNKYSTSPPLGFNGHKIECEE